jgi:thiamine transport system ATP-binding protein
MTTSPKAGIVLEGVGLQLGARQFSFDCALPANAITAITGPSGSGKSTLLNLIAGFETPDEGRVIIDGRVMNGLDPSQRPVSLVFQDNNLFAHLDLFTNTALGIHPALKLGSDDRARVSSALERVGLGGFEKRLPVTLSGGERQRAAVARALVRDRPLLLLDEPFAALDPGLRSGMAGLLADLHEETKNTVLIVSHHPDEVRRLADHVIFLDKGSILYQGTVDGFFQAQDILEIQIFLKG